MSELNIQSAKNVQFVYAANGTIMSYSTAISTMHAVDAQCSFHDTALTVAISLISSTLYLQEKLSVYCYTVSTEHV